MKKLLFFISVLVFSLGISVFCFADEPTTPSTYSLQTDFSFDTGTDYGRQTISISINNLDNRYVVFPVFYCSDNAIGDYQYDINCFLGMYDKTEDIIYLAQRSESEANFINKFIKYDPRIIIFTSNGNNFNDSMGYRYRANQDMTDKLNIKSNNYSLPYANLGFKPNFNDFGLNNLLNQGTWFIVGNNYPFPNPVYSTDIYYPSLFSLQFTMNETLSYRFGVELQGTNVVYSNLDNYYLEIFASTNKNDTVIYQSSYKLTDLYSDWYQSHKVYSVIDNFFNIFPNMNPHQEFTVFVRFRYMDNNVNLVSKYQFYVQPSSDIENPDTPKFFQGEGNLPTNLAPGSIQDSTYPQSSFDGNYTFGDFNALNFVKGGGGLPSLVDGVSTVFSFLPPWLWQMMWYILGALAVIALLKVVIS